MKPTPPVEVAAFDFDGTLTRSDTLGPFLRRALGWPRYLWVLLQCSPWLAAYVLRLMSNHRAKSHLLQVALAGWTTEQAERHAQNFVSDFPPDFWHPWGLAQLLQHQHAGHRCVLVSASPGVYLHAVGKSLGVDAVLCTEMEVVDGRYTGRMATANCHGEEKVRRLREWLTAQSGPDATPVLHVYGDTGGDKPMLRLAGHAWYRGRPWQPPSP